MTGNVLTVTEDAPPEAAVRLIESNVIGVINRVNVLHVFIVGSPEPDGASATDGTEWAFATIDAQPRAPSGPKDVLVERRPDAQGVISDEHQPLALRVVAESSRGVKAVKDHLELGPVAAARTASVCSRRRRLCALTPTLQAAGLTPSSSVMKLLVPLDGSPASERALEHALSLAAGNPGTLLILLNVQTPDALGLSDIRARSESDRMLADRRSEEVLRKPAETCGKHHVSCEKRAEYGGTVAETIVGVARETGADQIVMGARGLGRLRGLMLGSVTTQVVHLADVPVTLVKAALRRQHEA